MDRTRIRDILLNHYDDGELRTLCFDLGVDYDSLLGDNKADKAREMVTLSERHSRRYDLLQAIYESRPHALIKDKMDDALRQDAGQSARIARQETGRFEPLQPIPSRTGPLRENLHQAMMQGIERLGQNVDDLTVLIHEWINRSSTNRALILALGTLYLISLFMFAFLIVTLGR